MTLSKSGRQRRPRHQRPSGGSEAYEEKQPEDSAAATPYKGSRCCIGFFQCQVCSHEWSSVYSWANSGQLCKPCSSRRRQTWVLPFRQIPKSRKYEFFCVDCDQYIAESYRNRDAHQGIACKTCKTAVYPDWEFPCDTCNIVHLYSFSKTEAMRGIDCDCGAFLFPKHMKSLNKKHESRFCQRCQELGVNCCNFKAAQQLKERHGGVGAAETAGGAFAASNKKATRPGANNKPRGAGRASVFSVEADVVEKKPAARNKRDPVAKQQQPRRKKTASTSSADYDGGAQVKTKRRPVTAAGAAAATGAAAAAQKRPPRRRRPKASVSSEEGETGDDTAPSNYERRKRPVTAKGRKKSTDKENYAEEVVENEVSRSSNRGVRSNAARGRGGRGGAPRGSGVRVRAAHVYAEDDVLHHARTPKNSVATDPGIRVNNNAVDKAAFKRSSKPRPPRRPRVAGSAAAAAAAGGEISEKDEVDALADKVAEAIIISARQDVEKAEDAGGKNRGKEAAIPRQQKDENHNDIEAETAVEATRGKNAASPKSKAVNHNNENVELKGGHPPAIKVGGRRRVSSARKSESDSSAGKKEAPIEAPEGDPDAAADNNNNNQNEGDKELAKGDPDNSQVQVTTKSKVELNHSEMPSSLAHQKPSPTKDVTRMAKVHPHHPTNKHPIQQPKKC